MSFGDVPAQSGEAMTIRRVSQPLFEAKGWMKLLAVLSIVAGVMVALTIIGLIIAWLPIWIGVLLWQSADSAERAHGIGESEDLQRALAKLKTIFVIYGILVIIQLAFFAFALVIGGISGFRNFGP